MTRLICLLGVLLIAADSLAGEKSEILAFVDIATGKPIANATVGFSRFAFDAGYEIPHPDLLIVTRRANSRGTTSIDLNLFARDTVVHIKGYEIEIVRYSPVLDSLNLSGDVRGHVRLVREPATGDQILGNSVYDLDHRKEYFINVAGEITTKAFEVITVELKRCENPEPPLR